jgi:uncharacterized RDD family membrane protein YckC
VTTPQPRPVGYYAYPPPPPPPPALSPGGRPLAEFVDRLLAWLIDSLILTVVVVLVTAPLFIWAVLTQLDVIRASELAGVEPTAEEVFGFVLVMFAITAAILVLSIVLTYLYEVEFLLWRGQTVGKKVMKLAIVPMDPAARLTRGMAVRRFLIEHAAAAVVPALSLVDGLWQLWDKPYRQCLHDKFAGTVVIKLDA